MKYSKEENWVSSKSLSDAQIKEYCKEIISSPTVVGGTPMYTKKQMISMFKRGFEKGIFVYPFSAMRQMDVYDRLVFPYEKWNSVRTAASKLKKQFGCTFRVRKDGPHNEKGDIVVVRIS